MIHSFYHHGDDVPATGLTVDQIKVASADPAGVLWVDLDAPGAEEIEAVVTGIFGAHPLTLAECADSASWPMLTDCGRYVFMVALAPAADEAVRLAERTGQHDTTGLALYLGHSYVVTVHQSPLAAVTELREEVGGDAGLLAQGADRLAAEILGRSAGGERSKVEAMAQELRDLEAAVFRKAGPDQIRQLCALQGRLATSQRQLASQQQALQALTETPLVRTRPENRLYFQAAHGRLKAAAELVEALCASAAALAAAQQHLNANRLSRSVLWLARAAIALALLVLAELLITWGPRIGAIIGHR